MFENAEKYKNAYDYYGTEPLNLCPQLFNENTHLPIELHDSYRLCMILHDEMLKLILNGIENNCFSINIPLNEKLKNDLNKSESHILNWLEKNNFITEKSLTISLVVLKATIEDMLLCLYESLEMARKGKMSLAFILIRKPIQENIFLVEDIILSFEEFSQKLENNPQKLHGTKFHTGENQKKMEAYTERTRKVLEETGGENLFNPSYIAQLRYDKSSEDSFDRICNKSMHLFTTAPSIKTEHMNINMVFSQLPQITTQFHFYFSRSVYLFSYIYHLVSFLGDQICPTSDEYKIHMKNVIGALTKMWFSQLSDRYKNTDIENFAHNITKQFQNDLPYRDCIEIIKTGKYKK